jgi:hypothetical protein
MFGGSRKTIFRPSVYEPGRRTRRIPRWLVLLCAGIALGAGGVLFFQHNYGPRRLTAEESRKLLDGIDAGTQERQRLQAQLAEARDQRAQSQAAQEKSAGDLAQANERVATLTQTLNILQDAVPADPRGGNIGVRWSEFIARGAQVNYRALIMREQAGKLPAFQGRLTIELSGTRNGRADAIVSQPVPFTLERFAPLQGSIALPEGFTPRQATLRVTDAQDRAQAMRIYFVRGSERLGQSPPQ